MNQMPDPIDASMIFPRAEFEARTRALQSQMRKAGLGALLLTQAADIFYVSGFLTRFWESPARPWFLIVPVEAAPIAVIPSIGQNLMQRTWVQDIRCWPAPNPGDDGISLLASSLKEVLPDQGLLGIPMQAETHLRMPLNDFNHLRNLLPKNDLVDATHALHSVREIKSEAEIEAIRASCHIAGRAFEDVPDLVAQDPRMGTIFRRFQMSLLEHGADWVSYVAGGAGQDGYDDVISPADAMPLRQGDVLMLDTGAVRNGYFCDFDRNFSVGPASDVVKRAHAALWQATETALRSLRPGMTAAEAHRMLAQSLVDAGQTPAEGRLGHGLGVTLTEWPSFTPKDHSVLRAGMVLTLEPAAILPNGRMIVHEENIVLREDGPELLSPRAPDEMPEVAL